MRVKDSTLIFIVLMLAFSFYGLVNAADEAYMLQVYHTGRIASLQMPQQEYDDLNDATKEEGRPILKRRISNFLYKNFDDDFDYIILISNNDSAPVGLYYGRRNRIKNDVNGIGVTLSDDTALYGSSGRLRGIIHFTARDYLKYGPSLHELMHSWANYILETSNSGHWGFSSVAGQLGGFKYETLQDLGGGIFQATNGQSGSSGFGEFANGGNSLPYSEIELYLMGMIEASQVPPLYVAVDPAWIDYSIGKFSTTGFTQHTIEDIVQQYGVRSPSAANSQKDFKALTVVLTPQPLTEDEWEEVDQSVQFFSFNGDDGSYLYNFREATNGLATITMDKLHSSLNDYSMDLRGAILSLQIVSGIPLTSVNKSRDINENGKVGLEEAIYALQVVSGARTTPPKNVYIEINNGAEYTCFNQVAIFISATDDVGITGYYLSGSPGKPSTTDTGWVTVSPTKSYSENVSFTLGSGGGDKAVYVWFKDSEGNISSLSYDSINLFTGISNISLNPATPATLGVGESVYVTFDYQIDYADGARIYIKPYTNGSYTPDGFHQTSIIYTGSNSTTKYIGLNSAGIVNQLRIYMKNPDLTTIYYEEYIPVEYEFTAN